MEKKEALRHFFHHSKGNNPLDCDASREALRLMVVPGHAARRESEQLKRRALEARDHSAQLSKEREELFMDAEYVMDRVTERRNRTRTRAHTER